jgi:hypothetical protein
MLNKLRFSLALTVGIYGVLTFGPYLFAHHKPATSASSKNRTGTIATMKVSASTDYGDDTGYSHCFKQHPESNLVFKVNTNADTVNFILWNIGDPTNPLVAEPSKDWPVKNGYVEITVAADRGPNRPHLGPGPYMAALTGSSSAKASGQKQMTSSNAAYYYETWKTDHSECKYH